MSTNTTSAASTAPTIEVVARWETVAGVHDIVAWEVWSGRELARPGVYTGDLVDVFDNEHDANTLRASLLAEDATEGVTA